MSNDNNDGNDFEEDNDSLFDTPPGYRETRLAQLQTGTLNKKDQILRDVGEFLKEYSQEYPGEYVVFGGRAINAYLNQRLEGFTEEYKPYAVTSDWDIIVYGDDNTSIEFNNRLLMYLQSRYPDVPFEVTTEPRDLGGHNVYQLGVEDGEEIDYIVDTHAEMDRTFFNNSVEFNGIKYPRFSVLYHTLEAGMDTIDEEKLVKRQYRRRLVLEAVRNIRLFNPQFFVMICQDCLNSQDDKEHLTGFELNCDELIPICDSNA